MSRRHPLLAVLLAFATAIALAPVAGAATPPADGYIVVLKDGADSRSVADQHRRRHGAKVAQVYRHALNGYAARISGSEIGAVRSDKRVAYVERDGVVRASATQTGATWGLDRVDQRGLPLSKSFSYEQTGAGVTAYIIDTGLRSSHSEITGRTAVGFDAFGGDGSDCNGHGTHVGGTVGGTKYGVAKAVRLVSVRVLDCSGSGTWSGVIAGVDWVAAHHVKPAVANMSLGGGASSSVDTAVSNAIKAGVSFSVAAGNSNADACRYSPARVAEAITVAATDSADRRASFSNYGSCVDLFAPGVSITSAWYQSDTQTNTISGTSMAAPHVAGAAALELEFEPGSSPAVLRDRLYADATKDVVTSSSSANALLYTGPTSAIAEPAPTPPAAGITLATEGSKVKGYPKVNLAWQGTTASVDVFRNTERIASNVDGGSYTDTRLPKGGGSYTYKVCEAGTTTCSNESTVTF